MFVRAIILCSVVAVALSRGLSAQRPPADTLSLTLAEARARAVEANHDLRAASWRPVAARGDLRSARLLRFNPEVLFESRTTADGFTSRYEGEVGLEVEVAGQAGLRGGAAEASMEAASSTLSDVGRRLLAEVAFAYYGLAAAEKRFALVSEIGRSNEQLLEAVQTQLAEGELSVLEANLATIETARARARALEATGARTTAALELERLIGMEPSGAVRTRGSADADFAKPTGSEAALLAQALADRPDLRAAESEVERARDEARLVRREAFPNLRIAGLVTRDDPSLDPRFGVSFGIELPLFNRSQGLTDRRNAEIAEAEEGRRSAELRVRTQVENALRAFESARAETELLEAELLQPIRQNSALLEIAYREGKMDLTSLLLVRNQLLDAELSYWDAWERRARAYADLQAATGAILEDVTITEGIER
ncbi:MAG: TolC family protein [Gemmatimonadales bacterium]